VTSTLKVAYVVRSWPRLSQTFVLNEILALERIGVRIAIFSMTRAKDPVTQAQVAEVAAPVHYLDELGHRGAVAHLRLAAVSPRRYFATLAFALTHRELLGGYTKSSALEAFDRAAILAERLQAQRRHGSPCGHIHAHFAHDPALVALLAHRLTGLPFSWTAHARDLYQIPDPAILGRAREASVVVAECRRNLDIIARVVGDKGPPIELVYNGIDLGMFRPASTRTDNSVPLIVSVGRLVEKKGFDDLLRACALLAGRGVSFRCEIYGDGPCRAELEALRDRLGLGQQVDFCGTRTQMELLPVYQRADVFALTSRVTPEGDADGVPTVIVEAMACGLPIVSTRVSGIPEAVAEGSNGLLAPAEDAGAISACLAELIGDPERRRRLGQAAADTAQRFDRRAVAERLAALFGHAA